RSAHLLLLVRIGDDHLLLAAALRELHEAQDLGLGALRGRADDDAVLVAQDSASPVVLGRPLALACRGGSRSGARNRGRGARWRPGLPRLGLAVTGPRGDL